MSVITVGGRTYAAGLYWLARGGRRATARTARRLGRPWCVHDGERTGFAADDGAPEGAGPAGADPAGPGREGRDPEGLHPESSDPSGLAALALALKAHIEGEFWMALVGGTGGDGGGRYALVKARGGAVLADGDEAFGDRAAALAAFDRARGLGWTLHATPGLAAELAGSGSAVAALDPVALGETAAGAGAAIVLTPAAPARDGRKRVAAVAVVAALAAVAAVLVEREALMSWLAAPQPAPAAPRPDPAVAVAVDGAALIAACRQALIENPPFLPAWRIEGIACAARFDDPALASLRPELAGGPVLLVRWSLRSGHAEALQRRLAEGHLARWHAASVADGRAWAAAPLGSVLRIADEPAPSLLELRRAVDRAFGAVGAGVGYARDSEGVWTVRIDDPGPLGRLGPLAGGVAGLEITKLSRGEDTRAGAAAWRLEARPMAPETVAASGLATLGIPGRSSGPGSSPEPARDPAAGVESDQPGKEAEDGTQNHDGV